jgi:hypothetical protein
MSTMPKSSRFDEPLSDALLDRLVEGELTESQRREVLLRLEAQPDGWKRCALAFLEAQSWRQAFAPLAQEAKFEPIARPSREVSKPGRFKTSLKWVMLAASFLGVFALGWLSRQDPEPTSRALEVVVEKAQPVRSVPAETQPPTRPDPFQAVVQAWEQRGYFAERQNRSVTVQLHDGRKVDVPVQEVRLRNFGNRTY